MAAYVGLSTRIYVGILDLSGMANEVNVGPATVQMKDATTFNDGGFTVVKPGLITGKTEIKGFQDYASGAIGQTIATGQLGSQYPVTVIPNPTGTVTAGDVAEFSRGRLAQLDFMHQIGEMAKQGLMLPYDTAPVNGYVSHPLAARTTTGTGTAVAMAGPSASQYLYSAVHVTAYSGLTNVVFTIESDDNGGFSSATTRITHATVTGTTSEFKSVAGDFSTETHHRIKWTVTGTGSITFVAAFGVL